MPRIRFQPEAQRDYRRALEHIANFFVSVESEEKILDWKERFESDFRKALALIAKDPLHYPICVLYPFDDYTEAEVRKFKALWFYGLYSIVDGHVQILRIVSDRSDMTKIL